MADGTTVAVAGAPAGLESLFTPRPERLTIRHGLRGKPDLAMLFVRRRRELERRIAAAGRAVFPDRRLWVCWPKRSSGVASDVTEDVVRDVALPTGLVDVKVAAIDDTWSGLCLVWRRERRPGGPEGERGPTPRRDGP